jgi:hypothetical protein
VVLGWLEEMTYPAVIGVADETNSKKLGQAINKGFPLLVVVERDSSAQHVLRVF